MWCDQFFYQFVFFRRIVSLQYDTYPFQILRRLQCRNKILHRVIYNRCGIHYRRNTDRDHRDSHRLFRDHASVIPHTRSGMDPGIRDLYGPVQSFTASCRQRIDHQNHIRLCLLYDSLHNLCRLHPCLRHHSRNDCTYDPAFFFYAISSIFLYHMPGDIQLIYHIWSQRIRRHFTVTKPYCQYRASLFFRMLFFRFLIFHIFFQKSCQSF